MIIIIILIVVALGIAYILCKNKRQPIMQETEHFQWEKEDKPMNTSTLWDPLWVGKVSSDCYSENHRDCMNYSNCGLCIKDGQKQCVPGDAQGAFFKEGCDQWQHTNYYDRHIFGEKVTTITPSWDKFYPEFEAHWPSPVSWSTLQ